MLDAHTHVLPGMDDGSKNVTESVAMLKTLKAQGVTTVFATPHFYADADSPEHFLAKRTGAMAQLKPKLTRDCPEVFMGAEVHYFAGMSNSDALYLLRIEHTNLLLLEMPFCQWTQQMILDVKKVQMNLQIQVVLAHVERYFGFIGNRAMLEELLDVGVEVQLNVSAFCSLKTARKAFQYLDKQEVHFLGSDCHNMEMRAPNWDVAHGVMRKKKKVDAFCAVANSALEQLELVH